MSTEKDKAALQDAWLEEVAKKRDSKGKEVLAEVEKLENKAMAILNKATALCDKHGISHYFSISPLSQTYNGEGSQERIEELVLEAEKTGLFDSEDEDVGSIIRDFLECGYDEYDGWQHSAVC